MKRILIDIEDAIIYHEEKGLAYLPYYTYLIRKRNIIKRTIRKLDKLGEKYGQDSDYRY